MRALWIPFMFCLVPLAATSRRAWLWLTSVALACLVMLAAYSWWMIASSGPDVHGFATAIVAVFIMTSGVALAAGAAGRAGGLVLQRRGHSRVGVLWTDGLALALPAVLLLYLGLI